MAHVYLTKDQINARRAFRSGLPVRPTAELTNRPSEADLKNKCPFIYDQGQIGSCTANAICMALVMMETGKFLPSRLWLYYKERLVELKPGQQITDSGADAADGLSILLNYGVAPETDWPYDAANCDVAPPAESDQDAIQHKIHQATAVAQSGTTGQALIDAISQSIVAEVPVLIGIQVYESFESAEVAQSGDVPLPQSNEEYLGGHEVLIVGYDDTQKVFICVNSWGDGWGQEGFFTLPYDYVTNPELTSEFICITKA